MIYIEHRKNAIQDLPDVDPAHGVEVDLRTRGTQIILAHDAFQDGDGFEAWLDVFLKKGIRGPLLLNTKEDGLENSILKILNEKNFSNFLFLDTAFPTLVKYANTHADKLMIRLSSREPLDLAMPFSGRVKWLWVDCFDGVPLEESILSKAAEKFKLCMVSPELQGKDLKSSLTDFKKIEKYFNAICTKYSGIWLGSDI